MKQLDKVKLAEIDRLKAELKFEIKKGKDLQEKINKTIEEIKSFETNKGLKPANINFKAYATFEGDFTYDQAIKVLKTKIKFIQEKNRELSSRFQTVNTIKLNYQKETNASGLSDRTEDIVNNIINKYGERWISEEEFRSNLNGDEDYDEAKEVYDTLVSEAAHRQWREEHPDAQEMTPEEYNNYLKGIQNF